MKYEGIPYEAFGEHGAFIREARVIHELPLEQRMEALEDATDGLARAFGLQATLRIPFGSLVYQAFGLTRPEAKKHEQAAIMLTIGAEVPLTFCN